VTSSVSATVRAAKSSEYYSNTSTRFVLRLNIFAPTIIVAFTHFAGEENESAVMAAVKETKCPASLIPPWQKP